MARGEHGDSFKTLMDDGVGWKRIKSRLAEQLRLWHTGLYRVRRPVGGLLFWVFSVAMIWRRRVGADFSGLFGFGPKPGGLLAQKRNETPETPETLGTPETLCVDVGIAFL